MMLSRNVLNWKQAQSKVNHALQQKDKMRKNKKAKKT